MMYSLLEKKHNRTHVKIDADFKYATFVFKVKLATMQTLANTATMTKDKISHVNAKCRAETAPECVMQTF